jgi:hypothetical protein
MPPNLPYVSKNYTKHMFFHKLHLTNNNIVYTFSSLIFGLSVASGPTLVLLVLGTILLLRKIKEHMTKALKQKYLIKIKDNCCNS